MSVRVYFYSADIKLDGVTITTCGTHKVTGGQLLSKVIADIIDNIKCDHKDADNNIDIKALNYLGEE